MWFNNVRQIYLTFLPFLNWLKKIMIIFTVLYSVIMLFSLLKDGNIKSIKTPTEKENISLQQEIEIVANNFANEPSEMSKTNASFYRGMMCLFMGYSCNKDATPDSVGGFVGTGLKFITLPYANPIASGYNQTKNWLSSIGFIPEAYAWEGVGFATLSGYGDIWKAFRDTSYLALTLIVIGIGFMIMFRFNAGQAEVKIESALPNIVLALILITFSFAIAGFLIDIMYATIALSIGLFFSSGLDNLTGQGTSVFQNTNFLYFAESGFLDIIPIGGRLLGSSFSVGNDLWNMLPTVISKALAPVLTIIAIIQASTTTTPAENFIMSFFNIQLVANGWGYLPNLVTVPVWLGTLLLISNYLPGLILGFTIALTMLIFMFRMFFIFLEAYIKILLYVLFSPLILMMSAIPGNGNATWWIKNIMGELSVFPTFIIITMTSAAIIEANNRLTSGGSLSYLWWQAGGAGQSFNLPFVSGGFRPESFNNVISLGLLLMAPDLIKMVKGMFGVEGKGLSFSPSLFFGSIGALTGVMGSVNSLGTSIMGQSGWENMRGKFYSKAGKYAKATGSVLNEKWTGVIEKNTSDENDVRKNKARNWKPLADIGKKLKDNKATNNQQLSDNSGFLGNIRSHVADQERQEKQEAEKREAEALKKQADAKVAAEKRASLNQSNNNSGTT